MNNSIEIIYSDTHLLVINKPTGCVMHASPGHDTGTLAHYLLTHWPGLASVGEDPAQPGMIHRLDKDTSGLVIVAQDNNTYYALKQQMRNRTVKRMYLACVARRFERGGLWYDTLGRSGRQRTKVLGSLTLPYNAEIPAFSTSGQNRDFCKKYDFCKHAVLWARGICSTDAISLVSYQLHTGIQHQIRCQSSYRGNPILGDVMYGRRNSHALSSEYGMTLHAYQLTFLHPATNKIQTVTCYPRWLSAVCNEIGVAQDALVLES